MDRKRKRHSGLEDWTASRCQRLLRPIASRILPLRRLSYITDSQKISGDHTSEGSNSGTLGESRINSDNTGDSSRDPAWFPSQNRQPNLKKYSSRRPQSTNGNSAQVTSGQAPNNLISLPTPFKARALRRGTPVKQQHGTRELANSPSIGKKQLSGGTRRVRRDPFARAPLAKQSAELQNRQNYEKIFELHQGVSDGFSLLLQRTAKPEDQTQERRGVPSLLKMCLRKIPDYIQAEEDWRKSIDEDDDTDVSSEVYEELENLGVSEGHGWPGLRDVVLAHGVKLVREIIQGKLVSMNTRAELANMPLRHGLLMEAEELATTYSRTLNFKLPSKAQESSLFNGCLTGLRDIGFRGVESTRDGLHVRLIDELFHRGQLKLSWLASRDMIRFSSEMIRALASRSGSHADVVNFLHGRILQVCRVEAGRDGCQNDDVQQIQLSVSTSQTSKTVHETIVSIVTVLTAIVLIEREYQDPNQHETPTAMAETLLNSVAIDILRDLQSHGLVERDNITVRGITLKSSACFAVLTSVLVLCTGSKLRGNQVVLRQEDILQALSQIHGKDSATGSGSSTTVERAALYICDLAQCCGQSFNSSGLDYLQGIVQRFMCHSKDQSTLENTMLRQLALESSLHFARTSATQKSRLFMETIENAMVRQEPLSIENQHSSKDQASSPVKRQSLRWEEGLCEWIAATPLALTKQRPSATHRTLSFRNECIEEEDDINDSGYISALQETPAPRKRLSTMPELMSSPDVLGADSESYSRAEYVLYSPDASPTSPVSSPTRSTHSAERSGNCSSTTKNSVYQAHKLDATDDIESITAPLPVIAAKSKISNTANRRYSKKATSKRDQSESTGVPAQLPETLREPEKKKRKTDVERMGRKAEPPSTMPATKSSESQNVEPMDKNDDEEDELAMSCKKPRQSRQIWKSTRAVSPKSRKARPSNISSSRTTIRVSDSLNASEDELG